MDDFLRFFNFLKIGAEKDERRLKKIEPAKDMTGASEAQFNLQLFLSDDHDSGGRRPERVL